MKLPRETMKRKSTKTHTPIGAGGAVQNFDSATMMLVVLAVEAAVFQREFQTAEKRHAYTHTSSILVVGKFGSRIAWECVQRSHYEHTDKSQHCYNQAKTLQVCTPTHNSGGEKSTWVLTHMYACIAKSKQKKTTDQLNKVLNTLYTRFSCSEKCAVYKIKTTRNEPMYMCM